MPQSKLTNVQAMGKRGRSLEADRQASTLDALKAQSNVFTSPSALRMGGRRHGMRKCPQLRELSAHKRQRGIRALFRLGHTLLSAVSAYHTCHAHAHYTFVHAICPDERIS